MNTLRHLSNFALRVPYGWWVIQLGIAAYLLAGRCRSKSEVLVLLEDWNCSCRICTVLAVVG